MKLSEKPPQEGHGKVLFISLVFMCSFVSVKLLVYASLGGEISRESSVSSCLLDLNPCVKSSEAGQAWLHMLLVVND